MFLIKKSRFFHPFWTGFTGFGPQKAHLFHQQNLRLPGPWSKAHLFIINNNNNNILYRVPYIEITLRKEFYLSLGGF